MVEMKTVIPKIDEDYWRCVADVESTRKEKRHEPGTDGGIDRITKGASR